MKVKATGRAWFLAAGLAIVYAALYPALARHGGVINGLAKAGLAGSVIAPLLFIGAYTGIGLLGGAAKWWKNDIGLTLVLYEVAALCQAGPLAYAIIFNNGILNTPSYAWLYDGGLLSGTLIILWRTWVFLRVNLESRKERIAGSKADAPLLTATDPESPERP